MTRKKILLFIILLSVLMLLIYIYLKKETTTPAQPILSYTQSINSITYTTEGRTQAIQELESILRHSKKISKEDQLTILKELTTLCIINTDYSKAIEHSLSGMTLAQSLENHYILARIMIDLSGMFITLGEYDMAKNIVNEALSLPISPFLTNRLSEYGYMTLAFIALKQNNFEEAISYTDISVGYIDQEQVHYRENALLKQIILAAAYCGQSDFTKSLSILEYIENDIALYGNRLIPNLDINFYATLGLTHILLGNLDLGFEISNQTLALCDDRNLPDVKLTILEDLSRTLHEETILDYSHIIYDYEHQLRSQYHEVLTAKNRQNISYILTTYADKQKLVENFQYKVQTVKLSLFIILLTLFTASYTTLRFRKIKQANKLDGLTNIYNRKTFDTKYKKYLDSNKIVALIIIDIDYFKKINDTYGHSLGDVVLKDISIVINHHLGHNQALFRYGGEEFCILCKEMSHQEVIDLAETIRLAIEKMCWRENFQVTISCGIAYSSETTHLFQLADKRLYASKENGRNQITYQ